MLSCFELFLNGLEFRLWLWRNQDDLLIFVLFLFLFMVLYIVLLLFLFLEVLVELLYKIFDLK